MTTVLKQAANVGVLTAWTSGKPARSLQGTTGFPYHLRGIFNMDVPNSSNECDSHLVPPPTKSTPEAEQINEEPSNKTNVSSQTKMHIYVTFFVLGLLLLIVVYSLLKQLYWLVGLVSVRVVISGVGKIFNRYL
jgi:hypothetical protein